MAWYGMAWHGMVEVCEGAPLAVSGWVLTDRCFALAFICVCYMICMAFCQCVAWQYGLHLLYMYALPWRHA